MSLQILPLAITVGGTFILGLMTDANRKEVQIWWPMGDSLKNLGVSQ